MLLLFTWAYPLSATLDFHSTPSFDKTFITLYIRAVSEPEYCIFEVICFICNQMKKQQRSRYSDKYQYQDDHIWMQVCKRLIYLYLYVWNYFFFFFLLNIRYFKTFLQVLFVWLTFKHIFTFTRGYLLVVFSLLVVYDTVSNQMTYNICYTAVSWSFTPLRQSSTDFLPFSYHNYVQQLRGAQFSRPFPHYDDKERDD